MGSGGQVVTELKPQGVYFLSVGLLILKDNRLINLQCGTHHRSSLSNYILLLLSRAPVRCQCSLQATCLDFESGGGGGGSRFLLQP